MKAIVAVDDKWGIGLQGKLLFTIHQDLHQFKERTIGNTIVMGRKTLNTFPGGKALPGRRNVVLSHGEQCDVSVVTVNNIAELLRLTGKGDDVFVVGGEMVYDELLDFCDTVYVTKVDGDYHADAHFPNLDLDLDWVLSKESEPLSENDYQFTFCEYTKKS